MSNKMIVSLNDIAKVYESGNIQVEALKGINFNVYQGEMIAIMGSSGSGKSTLLNIIGALDSPSRGSIIFDGCNIENFFEEPNATKFRSENIGFIFQSYNLLKDLTVEENVALPLLLKKIDKQHIIKATEEMLSLVDLDKWKKHRSVELSGGQQQRVAIARALIASPRLLLADEPTGNLDYNTANDIMTILRNLNSELEKTIIIVTHDPGIAAYADRIIFLKDGLVNDTYEKQGEKGDMKEILNIIQKMMEG